METEDQQSPGEVPWPSATELNLPADYPAILLYPPEKIKETHARLETTCGSKLASHYRRFGTVQARTLQSKIFFAASVLLEQTADKGQKRKMVVTLRQMPEDNPDYPSVACVYRTIAPLKVWLSQQCGLDHVPSVKELREDKRPLLMLTADNLSALVESCKTSRKFVETYRPTARTKTEPATTMPATNPLQDGMDPASRAESPQILEPLFLIQGRLSLAEQKRIAGKLDKGRKLIQLDGPATQAMRQWLDQNPHS